MNLKVENLYINKRNEDIVCICPQHYKLHLNKYNIDISVNDIIEALDKTFKKEKIDCSRTEFNFYVNSIEYLLRAYRKGQKESDLKKAISEIQFIIDRME